jgi:N-acetylneuraminic acid mutarotase
LAHQVFVSYATEDADTASRVCALLEADDIQCWVAPRDVKAGTDYAASIMNAIRSAQLAVLVFSIYSNASPYALREIERAVAYGRPVLSLRVDDVAPNPSLEYYLHEWIDVPDEVEGKGKEIVATVRQLLAGPVAVAKSADEVPRSTQGPSSRAQPGAAKTATKSRSLDRKTVVLTIAVVLVVAAVGLGLGLGLTRGHPAEQAATSGGYIAWTEISPSGTAPSARGSSSMAYDQVGGRFIVFGGGDGDDSFNDTWGYEPASNTWTELKPSGALPPARHSHTMTYDPVTHRLIVFGGSDEDGMPLNDTWAYDPVTNTWTELKPSGTVPSQRSWHSMAYDFNTRRLMMFGGYTGAGASLNDTWAYDSAANNWAELRPQGRIPPERTAAALAYDAVSHRLIMFGGRGETGNGLNDTWAYDSAANAWTLLNPAGTLPTPRDGHSMVYDQTRGRLVIYGGRDSAGTSLDDAWAYDSTANMWTRLEPSGLQPLGRVWHVMAYDPASGRLTMFSGQPQPWTYVNDIWTCTPGS